MNTKSESLGNRFAELATLGLTLVALFLGWLLMNSVQGRTLPFEAGGVSGQVPQGWMTASDDGDTLFRASDRSAEGYATTYRIESIPVAENSGPADVISLLTLQRGRALTAFRVLSQETSTTVAGNPAALVEYVFVESDPDLTQASIPSVVRAYDYIFVAGERALVVSFWADDAHFESNLPRFLAFLQSLDF